VWFFITMVTTMAVVITVLLMLGSPTQWGEN
jgi:hypothetical protein